MAKGVSGTADQDLVRLYLEGVGRYRLLTKEDEVTLAQRIEAGRRAAETLAQPRPDRTPAEARELARLQRAGASAAEQFVNSNLRLVVSIAKKYQSAEMPLLDLIQEGNLGLIHAVEKFDWRKGFKFSTYATWWIRQAIGRGVDNASRTVRLPVHAGDQARRVVRMKTQLEDELGRSPRPSELAEQLQMSEHEVISLLRHLAEPVSLDTPIGAEGDTDLGDIVADSDAPSPFDVVADGMLRGELEKLLSRLDDREQQILRLRYGLDRGQPRTLEEVGRELNLTRERIRQIERSALTKLRRPSKELGVRDLLAS